mmetsp:Transcript_23528/g.53081  ORF Transcript_23528/g.53081 Transcript_23528/m.53081 type:complete len:127 (-) Transcript_23528:177-557(-)
MDCPSRGVELLGCCLAVEENPEPRDAASLGVDLLAREAALKPGLLLKGKRSREGRLDILDFSDGDTESPDVNFDALVTRLPRREAFVSCVPFSLPFSSAGSSRAASAGGSGGVPLCIGGGGDSSKT